MPLILTRSPRVLCLTLREGSVGHAVLDGFGVSEGSFFTSRLDHLTSRRRFSRVLRLVRSSCERFQPTRIVFGVPEHARIRRRALAKRLARALGPLRVEVSIRDLRYASLLLVERHRRRRVESFIERLAELFAPDLAPLVERARKLAWYWRPAWYALLGALAELVEHHPRVGAALARPDAFAIPSFRAAVVAAERRLTPSAV